MLFSGNGQWGDWGSWGECSTKCGDGIKTRSRLCDNPPPAEDGLPCEGSDTDEGTCTDNSECSGKCKYVVFSSPVEMM